MAKRDPFGRLPDENPLAGLGAVSNGSESTPVAEAPPSSAAAPVATPAPDRPATQAPDRPANPAPDRPATQAPDSPAAPAMWPPARPAARPASGGFPWRRLMRPGLIFRLGIMLIAGIGALASAVGGGSSSHLPSIPKIAQKIGDSVKQAGTSAAATTPPIGLGSHSLLLRRNLQPALRRLRSSGLGRLQTLAIRPERLDATLLTKGGQLHTVQIGYDGKLSDLGLSGTGFGQVPTIAFARIDAAAPERLARSAAGRLRRPTSQIDYAAMIDFDGQALWSVFMRDGKQFAGDARGRVTRRVS